MNVSPGGVLESVFMASLVGLAVVEDHRHIGLQLCVLK